MQCTGCSARGIVRYTCNTGGLGGSCRGGRRLCWATRQLVRPGLVVENSGAVFFRLCFFCLALLFLTPTSSTVTSYYTISFITPAPSLILTSSHTYYIFRIAEILRKSPVFDWRSTNVRTGGDGMAESAASWTEDLMVGSPIPAVAQGYLIFSAQKDERHQGAPP